MNSPVVKFPSKRSHKCGIIRDGRVYRIGGRVPCLVGEKSHFDKPTVINHRFYLNVT